MASDAQVQAATATVGRVLPAAATADLRRDRQAIEDSLSAFCRHPATPVEEAARSVLLSGGKRARPLLTCSVLRALGQDPRPHSELVTVVELVHAGSLLHDDIIDGAETRRGRPATHVAFDVPTAILAGDLLLARAVDRIARDGPALLQVRLAAAITDLCNGAAVERQRLFDPDAGLAHARRVNRLKTASLFAYASEAGAILARAPTSQRAAARAFGAALGEAFQVIDDLLDLHGDQDVIGKPTGQDVIAGAVTVPVALGLQRDPGLRDELLTLWRHARDPCAVAAVLERITARLDSVGAITAARELARDNATRAGEAVASLPPGPWQEHLHRLARDITERNS